MGTFCLCKFDQNTLDEYDAWASEHLKDFVRTGLSKLHVTVVRSRLDVPKEHWITKDIGDLRKKYFTPLKFAMFNHFSNRDKVSQKALVLKLKADYLVQLHRMFKQVGAMHDFADYNPHLTLCYNVPPDFDPSKLPLPKIKFRPRLIFTQDY